MAGDEESDELSSSESSSRLGKCLGVSITVRKKHTIEMPRSQYVAGIKWGGGGANLFAGLLAAYLQL